MTSAVHSWWLGMPRSWRTIMLGCTAIAALIVVRATVSNMKRSEKEVGRERSAYSADQVVLRDWAARKGRERNVLAQAAALKAQLFDGLDCGSLRCDAIRYVAEVAGTTNLMIESVNAGNVEAGATPYQHTVVNVVGSGRLSDVLRFIRRIEEGVRTAQVHTISIAHAPDNGPDGRVEFSIDIAAFGISQ